MKTKLPWSHQYPFPPTPHQMWTSAAKLHLAELIHWRLKEKVDIDNIQDRDIIILVKKLATSKAIKRFYRVRDYNLKANNKEVTYQDWLDSVLSGYSTFSKVLNQKVLTPEGEHYQIMHMLNEIIGRSYYKQYKRTPEEEHRKELVAKLLLAIVESYFYDTEFTPWIWTTARNIILSDGRDNQVAPIENELDIEIIPQASLLHLHNGWLDSHLQHEAILAAIHKIPTQRYRIVLLLIYLYELDNTELAAFFGVTVPQITTWKSRARKALRAHYTSP